jgi:hypothetical protein
MMKALLVMAALAVAIASPARAQSSNRDADSSKVASASCAGSKKASVGHARTSRIRHGMAPRASTGAGSARSPQAAFAPAPAFGTYRWPGAKYDADGRFVDQNSPGRW